MLRLQTSKACSACKADPTACPQTVSAEKVLRLVVKTATPMRSRSEWFLTEPLADLPFAVSVFSKPLLDRTPDHSPWVGLRGSPVSLDARLDQRRIRAAHLLFS
jgi:hypothetical protein